MKPSFLILGGVLVLLALGFWGTVLLGSVPESRDRAAFIAQLAQCRGQDVSEACFRGLLVTVARERGVRAALAAIRDVKDALPELYYGCHQTGHLLGALGYEEHRGDVRPALKEVEDISVCTNAYIHGVLIEYVAQHADADVAGLGRNACGEDADKGGPERLAQRSCYHGLGHALTVKAVYQVPRALGFCDKTSFSEELKHGCYFGALMEYMMSAHPDEAAYLRLCDTLAQRYQPVCYFGAFSNHLYNAPLILTGAARAQAVAQGFALCRQAPPEYRFSCWYGIGYIVNFMLAADKSTAGEECLRHGASRSERAACIEGAARRYLTMGQDEVEAFCGVVPAGYQAGCRGVIAHPGLP